MSGQKEASHWFFCENNLLISTQEGITWKKEGNISYAVTSSSMSDSSGNLLFYSDGETIWDKNHQAMLNGTGLFGNNDALGFQSVVIIPVRQDIYYVFTVGMLKNDPLIKDSTLCYTVVDMKGNHGKGEVIQKNIPVYGSVMNRIAAVKHANGIDTWVMAMSQGMRYQGDPSNVSFYSFLITPCGIRDTVITLTPYRSSYASGTIKFSPDGSRFGLNLSETSANEAPEFVFDFDASTGELDLTTVIKICPNQVGQAFTRCFSADSRYLYLWQGDMVNPNNLLQFDLTAPDVCASQRSCSIFPSEHFMLGLDGSIYFINPTPYIGTPPPERNALMRVVDSNLPLSASNIEAFLNIHFRPYDFGTTYYTRPPNFIESYFDPNYKRPLEPDFNTLRTCAGAETPLVLNTHIFSTSLQQIRWDFGDGTQSSLLLPVQATDTVKHIYTSPGTYTVKMYLYYACVTDSIVRQVVIDDLPRVNLGADTTVCEGTPYTFTLAPDEVSYLWQDGNTSSTYSTSNSGTYTVRVSNTCGQASDQVILSKREFKSINLITPNGDGLNDVFEVPGAVKGEGQLLVYDAWGSRVFFSEGYEQNWSAEDFGDGIYYYEYSYETCEPVKGWLQVLR